MNVIDLRVAVGIGEVRQAITPKFTVTSPS
jgi:hypothetical protein